MTIKELIEQLQKLDPKMEVAITGTNEDIVSLKYVITGDFKLSDNSRFWYLHGTGGKTEICILADDAFDYN